jgi:hypothetical protein
MRMREGARRRARVEESRLDGDRQGRSHAPRQLRFVRFDDHDRQDGGRLDLHRVPSTGHGLRRRYEDSVSRRGALPRVHSSDVSLAVSTTDTTAAGLGARSEGSGCEEPTATTTLKGPMIRKSRAISQGIHIPRSAHAHASADEQHGSPSTQAGHDEAWSAFPLRAEPFGAIASNGRYGFPSGSPVQRVTISRRRPSGKSWRPVADAVWKSSVSE